MPTDNPQQIDSYFPKLTMGDQHCKLDSIIAYVESMLATGTLPSACKDTSQEVELVIEAIDHAIYVNTSISGISNHAEHSHEHRLEAKYLSSTADKNYRVQAFRSLKDLSSTQSSETILQFYLVQKCIFAESNPLPQETKLDIIGDQDFLLRATENTKQIYQEAMNLVFSRTAPVVKIHNASSSNEKRLIVAFRRANVACFYSAISDLYHYYGLSSSKKHVEQFSNGITIISLYLNLAPTLKKKPLLSFDASILRISEEVSLLACIPQNKFQSLFTDGQLSLQETVYSHCLWVFVQHFIDRLGADYQQLVETLHQENNTSTEILSRIKGQLKTEKFTAEYIFNTMSLYPELIRALYSSFANSHQIPTSRNEVIPLPADVLSETQLSDLISKTVLNQHEEMVINTFRVFNKALLKTNFFMPTKVALSFRLDPSFLLKLGYPQPLYGMFLVVCAEGHGFHLRFQDIARGGIRIVKSHNNQTYHSNIRSLFDENYGLASTQQLKNKDIPEGGSKGVILLNAQDQDKDIIAFEKYIDSLIDLLLPTANPRTSSSLVDLYGRQEMLFLGPDENTAKLVDWATHHAHKRGAPWWKSFFTGKSPELGGIPHDVYGMTTLSVREFINGIYRKLDLDPKKVRKMQIGGPDGDLGSNEILLSNEVYTAIVDGSGVLVDPQGLDHDELIRLAKKRVTISQFDVTQLSKEGYRILTSDSDIKLPSGEIISNGMNFRNIFHFCGTGFTDIFVPCGGRPASINLSNVSKLIKDNKSLIPYVVEGANLFITQDAKLRLEQASCILFKDSSANKGGVTSSSLEVLASLSFDESEFLENMCIRSDGNQPVFYTAYVQAIQDTIKKNARLEFEAIWREHKYTNEPYSTISDRLSVAITKLSEEPQMHVLWDNYNFRRSVLIDALPDLLMEKIGLSVIMNRVPDSYLRAIFGSYLASCLVYKISSTPSQFAFSSFIAERMAKITC